MFADLNDADYTLINLPVDDMKCPAGNTLFRQNNEAGHIFSIRQGTIKLTRINRYGEQRILRILRPGNVAGLEAIITGYFEYDAIALTPVRVCRFPVEIIQRLDRESPRFHRKLMEE